MSMIVNPSPFPNHFNRAMSLPLNLVNQHERSLFYRLSLGLYIPWNYPEIPSEYRGFASRIEDDILITDHGCEVLTQTCPKEIDDLYSILDQRSPSIRSSS